MIFKNISLIFTLKETVKWKWDLCRVQQQSWVNLLASRKDLFPYIVAAIVQQKMVCICRHRVFPKLPTNTTWNKILPPPAFTFFRKRVSWAMACADDNHYYYSSPFLTLLLPYIHVPRKISEEFLAPHDLLCNHESTQIHNDECIVGWTQVITTAFIPCDPLPGLSRKSK